MVGDDGRGRSKRGEVMRRGRRQSGQTAKGAGKDVGGTTVEGADRRDDKRRQRDSSGRERSRRGEVTLGEGEDIGER